MEWEGCKAPPFFIMKLFETKKIYIEFPRVVYPKYQPQFDVSNLKTIKSIRVETKEQAEALEGEYVLTFKEVIKEAPRKRAPKKKQPKLEV